MCTDDEVISLCSGDIYLWIDDGPSLHLKSVTKFGDPVELNLEEVVELCEVLKRLAKKLA